MVNTVRRGTKKGHGGVSIFFTRIGKRLHVRRQGMRNEGREENGCEEGDRQEERYNKNIFQAGGGEIP